LPDPCDAGTFEASRPDGAHRASPDAARALELVRSALAVRRTQIAPRQALLLTGHHTAQRVGATGLRVNWRYSDGQTLMLELNLGAQPLHVAPEPTALTAAKELFHHAWPAGTGEDVWPAWAARWSLGKAGA
ncbi:MAG TPA: DUF3459 domain-containing protein, partial [Ideonella sp.]|nr:DUF3459 domain-containing protein [Ideonella sp.]